MALTHVLDTNVVLYHLGGKLSTPLGDTPCFVSVITQLELLSYPGITPEDEAHIQEFLSDVVVAGLEYEICTLTVQLRHTHNLKLPDAIICATALSMDATLLTNDARLTSVSEIRVEPVPLKQPGDTGAEA